MSNSSSGSGDLSGAATIAVGVTAIIVGGIVTIVVSILIIRCIQARRAKNELNPTAGTQAGVRDSSHPLAMASSVSMEFLTIESFLNNVMQERPMRFTPHHLMIFTRNYAHTLGSGGFGVVYHGLLPNGIQIAVKVLHKTLNKRAEEQFMAEVGTMGRTYHINLVRLYGFCFDSMVKALVYEHMDNGSLDQYLFDSTRKPDWKKLHDIATGAAKGIRYLHEECEKKIIHYDIKPGNLLLDANFCPKVADFGLAKLCDRGNTHVTLTGGRGTPGYAAPELWMPFPVTEKCDVYSFGMLLFEMLGRRRNLDFGESSSLEWFPRWVWERYERREIDGMMEHCGVGKKKDERDRAERMCLVALWCVQYEAEGRPSMSDVVRMLEGEVEVAPPLNPFHYLNSSAAARSWNHTATDSTSRTTSEDTSQSTLETVSLIK